MGCGQSKIESEEAVTRCKERKEFMKKAVSSRNAFAAAHSLYTISLKNTGAALSDYGQGEAELILPSPSPSPSLPSTSALPPPPPHPDYHQPAPLHRAASMPDLPIPKKHTKIDDAIDEDEEDGDADDEEEDDESEHRRRQNLKDDGGDARAIPPPAPVAAAPSHAQQKVAAETSEAAKAAPTPVWLSQYIFDTENIPLPSLSQPDVLPPPPLPQEEKEVVTELPLPTTRPPAAAQKEQEQVIKKKKKVQHQHAVSVGGGEGKRGRTAQNVPVVNLVQVLDELDVHFLKASESAHEVSKMLEATRMHYHSNFADNRGHIDHSARLMRVITWNRSCKGLKDYDGKDDFDNEESETHATILDKMLAWEKKLYDEVKAGELMKIEYQRKIAALNKQKKRGASPERLEKTKAAVSHLHTRYIVDMQSMDSTVSEINRLRDKQLYPKLVDLVDGMAKMWETMFIHHNSQYKIAGALRNLDISVSLKETSEQHYKRTQQLCQVLFDWHSRFQNLIKYQKEYIHALNDWLKLNLIPIESNLKEKVSSPPRVIQPAIQPLLLTWHDLLGKLPDERARGAIHIFSEVVNTILIVQLDELKLKEKCEDIQRECIRKRRAFDDWYQKYLEKKAAEAAAAAAAAAAEATEEQNAAVTDESGSNERADRDEIVVERRAAVESLMARLKEEEDEYHRTSKKVREKSIGSLKTHLPELFRALSEFAHECSQMYKKLRSITTETADALEAD